MSHRIAVFLLLSLTSCQFLASPAGIALEIEVAQDMLEIVEESLKPESQEN